MSYEQFRHSINLRLLEADIPAAVMNRVMMEIDVVSQDYKIERQCTDLIALEEGTPQMVKLFIASMAVKNCAMGTMKDYTRCLNAMFNTIRKSYNTITTNDIRLYLFGERQERKWCASTTEHQRVVINAFFNWLVDEEYLTRNPARTIPVVKTPKKKLKPLKQIELEKLRKACETPREKAIIDLLYASGVRVSEAVALTLDDINWQDRTILIRHGKGDKERTTCFNAESEVSLRSYLETRKGNDNHVFTKLRAPYDGISDHALRDELDKIQARIKGQIGIRATPHTFRRTTATTAADRGMPLDEIQSLLGHESIETTMRYVTTGENRVKQDYAKYLAG